MTTMVTAVAKRLRALFVLACLVAAAPSHRQPPRRRGRAMRSI